MAYVTERAVGQPAYQRLAADLRSQISSGQLPIGAPLPSVRRLVEDHGVSTTVARAAVNELRHEGLVIGQQGKAVYVAATPKEVAGRQASLDTLARQVDELRADVVKLTTQSAALARAGHGQDGQQGPGSGDLARQLKELRAAVAHLAEQLPAIDELRQQLGQLQAELVLLYTKVGFSYPPEMAGQAPASTRKRTGTK